jgi:prepilin-type N-terminal cleavage/methylation domain-containing protein
MTLKNSKGFTLVEMLVVIAIISVLAAALFPAINNALKSASATALKQKGRGVWVAITSANMEREPLNQDPLWPDECVLKAGIGANTKEYFTYLLSNDETPGAVTEDAEERVVADLTMDALIASGVPAGTLKDFGDANIAWGVVRVNDGTPSEIPFLISKNYYDDTTQLAQVADENDKTKLDLTGAENRVPFQKNRVVWVTRGGGTFDARPKYFTMKQVMGVGDTETKYDYWKTEQK